MKPCSIDIKDILEEESGLGLIFGSNMFVSNRPPSPSNVTVIYDAPGGQIDSTLAPMSNNYFHNGLQIQVRHSNYDEGMLLAHNIMLVLHGLNNFIHNTTYYAFIRCTSPPFLLEYDSQNRSIIIINFQIQRR